MSLILAFESSCDDTSVAIINSDYEVLCNLVSTQKDHAAFGGVLPELASRLHLKNILYLTETALKDTGLSPNEISALAVSINPGLIGSLIIGLSFAKSLAWSWGKPFVTVNHMLAHIFANFIEHPDINTPFLALVVSGGHTELVHFHDLTSFEVVGKTLDDAAGETFDKTAKLLGMGFPGGPAIDRAAAKGDPEFAGFPRALNRKGNYNFSYSGMKTAVLEYLAKQDQAFIDEHQDDLAASVQQAIIDPLINKSLAYAKKENIKTILLGGGVAANSALRAQLRQKTQTLGLEFHVPSLRYCVDNAAMVGAAAIPKYLTRQFSGLDVNAFSTKGTRSI
ncbi:MAG: tRNA (adenosine(37)-N6)-threonylcarbamoyltransferase complex transferase subunit TsaD [Candidatus Syntrophosphaera sp.]